jgi:hypothetical protein
LYLDGAGMLHGFVLTNPMGPTSHWQSIDDPHGVGSTVVNGINAAGDLAGSTGALPLTAVEVAPNGTSYGTPAGTASLSYNAAAQTLTVTVNASGLTPGKHAAHIHFGSCQNQGPVVYMLMDLTANSVGKIVNETRVLTGVTSAIPVNGWYLNIHQGNSNNILRNGAPTILFRPLLCANA